MSWRRYFRRARADADLKEEIAGYMVEEVAENRAHGMTEEEAWRRARLKFGNPVAVRETLWRQNTISLVDTIVRDLRYSMRTLLRAPGFSMIAIGLMALS